MPAALLSTAWQAQLSVGDGAVITGDVRQDRRPPRPGELIHSVMVRVENARAHRDQARALGARILMEPTDFEYGERQYSAEDLAGKVLASKRCRAMGMS